MDMNDGEIQAYWVYGWGGSIKLIRFTARRVKVFGSEYLRVVSCEGDWLDVGAEIDPTASEVFTVYADALKEVCKRLRKAINVGLQKIGGDRKTLKKYEEELALIQ